MSLLYKLFLLYPYWLLKTILHYIFIYFKSIFSFHIDDKKIDSLSGIEFEMLVRKLLVKQGYKNVRLTKTTQDYGIDILARKKGVLYGFQCKRYQKNIGVDAIQQAKAGLDFYNLDDVGVITNSYFTPAAYQLASVNDIVLIDRTALFKDLKKAKLMKSNIPFITYLITILLLLLFMYIYYIYHDIYALISGCVFLLLLFYMICKTYHYRKLNHVESYTIHEYN